MASINWFGEDASWLFKIQNLQEGDACEFHYPARTKWLPGTVVKNGSSYYWHVRDNSDVEEKCGEVCMALYIEHVRLPGQTEAWPRRGK